MSDAQNSPERDTNDGELHWTQREFPDVRDCTIPWCQTHETLGDEPLEAGWFEVDFGIRVRRHAHYGRAFKLTAHEEWTEGHHMTEVPGIDPCEPFATFGAFGLSAHADLANDLERLRRFAAQTYPDMDRFGCRA